MSVEQISEMKFGRSDRLSELSTEAFSDGEVNIEVAFHGNARWYTLTPGQAIQLRDFLNRHIDELALKQTGSLAVRSSDDPNQLAAVEEVPVKPGCGEMVIGTACESYCGENSWTRCQECGGTHERFDPEKHLL